MSTLTGTVIIYHLLFIIYYVSFGVDDEESRVLRGSVYRGTSLIRNSAPLGPYSRTMPRAL